MNRLKTIKKIRKNLNDGGCSVGSWMQIPNSSIAEIMGQAGYDWVAVDMEHGAISTHQLPDLFRALELGGTLPLVRLAHGEPKDCKQALDAGAGGVIVPMVESEEQLIKVRDASRWPPSGSRGVAFSRANLFGKNFKEYFKDLKIVSFYEKDGECKDRIDMVFHKDRADDRKIWLENYDKNNENRQG